MQAMANSQPGATEQIAQFVVDSRFGDLPANVVDAAKIAVLDGIGVMLAGSMEAPAQIVAEYVRTLGGASACTVAGTGFKTNAPSAAFANGVAGHCLDFEIQGNPPTHGTSSCLPAALALAEQTGAGGSAVIEAYVLAWEVQGRLRAASAHATRHAFHPPGLVGPIGSAVASAKILGLDAPATRMAIGVAASRTGGLTANTGTMTKSTHPGNAARMGVEAALLAQAGFTSSPYALESPTGWDAALFGGEVDWDTATGGLGASFRLTDPGFDIKRFPAQIYMQRSIEAALNLRETLGPRIDDIEAVVVETNRPGYGGSGAPSGLAGKFSLEYCAAIALLDGHVAIDSFANDRYFAPDVQALLGKVKVVSDTQLVGAQVSARMADGRTFNETCVDFRGAMANPMSKDERLAKFRYCAGRVLSTDATEQLLETIEMLERLPDVGSLMGSLSAR